MSEDPNKVMQALLGEIGDGLDGFFTDLTQEMEKRTPVDTGRAKAGWRKMKKAQARQSVRGIIMNPVNYSAVLDDGWSKQAPHGMVQPAIDATISKWKNK